MVRDCAPAGRLPRCRLRFCPSIGPRPGARAPDKGNARSVARDQPFFAVEIELGDALRPRACGLIGKEVVAGRVPHLPFELDTTAEALEIEFLQGLDLESDACAPAQRTSLKKTDAAFAAALVTTGVSPLCSILSLTRKEVISSSPRPLTRMKMEELGSWPGRAKGTSDEHSQRPLSADFHSRSRKPASLSPSQSALGSLRI